MSVEITHNNDGGLHQITTTVYGHIFEAYANNVDVAAIQLCDTISSNVGGYNRFNKIFPTLHDDILSLDINLNAKGGNHASN